MVLVSHGLPNSLRVMNVAPAYIDVKREFAKLNLSNGHVAPTEATVAELIHRLKKQFAPGKEGAWNMILDGLATILREGA